jgi:3-deoxy-D-manno-octulosonic-acid transferase
MRTFTRRIMRLVDLFCMQSELDRERIEALGAPPDRVQVLQSAKYEVAVRNPAGEADARVVLDRVGFGADKMVLMGGSTWPGEEQVLLEAYHALRGEHPDLRLLLVPRHFERTHEFIPAIEAMNLSYMRKTELADGAPDVFILDTTGEMSNYFAHAELIFIGKSLFEHGGQNIIEPAIYAKPIVVGPNMQNFQQVIRDMREAGAIVQVDDAESLKLEIKNLLSDSERSHQVGANALALVQANAGALSRTVELLSETLR